MRRNIFLLLLLFPSFVFCQTPHYSQLGSGVPGFQSVHGDTARRHHFVPKHNRLLFYKYDGSALYLKDRDTIVCEEIYRGRYDGRTADWILFHKTINQYLEPCYVALSDMNDIEAAYVAQANALDSIAKESELRQEEAVNYKTHVFRTAVMPVIILMLISLFVLKKWYIKVAGFFFRLTEHYVTTAIGLVLLIPIGIFFINEFDFSQLQLRSQPMTWVYKRIGFDVNFLNWLKPEAYSFWPIASWQLQHFLLAMSLFFSTWLMGGFFVNAIAGFLTAPRDATIEGASYNGGQTIYVRSYTPASDGADIDFRAVMKYYLIFSVLVPLMYFLAFILFGTSSYDQTGRPVENELRPVLVGAVLLLIVSLVGRRLHRKGSSIMGWIGKIALSFLGLAVIFVTLLTAVLVASWLIYLLR
ncbi:MAG: hypothetical protein JST42_21945 [Bacteroidetes bacterium]|nr:hypothetical protein [Bacteroidota bacterium]